MNASPDSVEALVEQFTRLPSIGRKTARRLASYVLKMPREDVARMAQALLEAKDRVRTCSTCFNLSDHDPCPVCRSDRRDAGLVCVVEEPSDVLAVERTGEYRGTYHVLGGAISPLDGVGPDDLKIRELMRRVAEPEENRSVREIILAMNPNVEGDTTAYYISQLLQPFDVEVTRIARGLPIGGDLEFADEATLTRALEGRLAL